MTFQKTLPLVGAILLTLAVGCSQENSVADAPVEADPQRPKANNNVRLNDGTDKQAPAKSVRSSRHVRQNTPATDEQLALNTTEVVSVDSMNDWAQLRGPHGNGHSSETGLIREFPADGPNILWRVPLGTGFSGISIADGRLFTLFGEEGREKVVCFDASSGKELWKIDSDRDFAQGRSFGPRATPCIDGDRLFTVGASGNLLCLDVATGKKVWAMNLYDEFNMRPHEEGLSPSPLVDGKRLIVLAGTSAFAFDKSNGKVIWKSLDEKINHSSPTVVTIGGRKQLIVLTGSNLVGLSLEEGSELWRREQRGVNCASPVVGPDDQIFTAASYGFGSQLTKITNGSAQQVYKNNVLATHHATAVLHEGHLYGFHDRPGIFKCVEFATGEEKWVSRQAGKGKLIIADGQMILLNEYGELKLAPVSPDGFRPTANARLLKGTCYTAPTLSNGRLYLRSDQEMACIDMQKQFTLSAGEFDHSFQCLAQYHPSRISMAAAAGGWWQSEAKRNDAPGVRLSFLHSPSGNHYDGCRKTAGKRDRAGKRAGKRDRVVYQDQ